MAEQKSMLSLLEQVLSLEPKWLRSRIYCIMPPITPKGYLIHYLLYWGILG